MFNEQIALSLYENGDLIKRPDSFIDFKRKIVRGLEIAIKKEEITSYCIADADRADYNLALKYNEQLMNTLLETN